MLQGIELASRDLTTPSDPYLYVTCGKFVFNDRENYKLDVDSPQFDKYIPCGTISLPGAPALVIQCWDYDDIFGDDIIGETSIDIDDRYFNPKW